MVPAQLPYEEELLEDLCWSLNPHAAAHVPHVLILMAASVKKWYIRLKSMLLNPDASFSVCRLFFFSVP